MDPSQLRSLLTIRNMRKAAEAMGAISASSSIPILQDYLSDSEQVVRETCEIAIAKIQWDNSEEGRKQAERSKDPETVYVHFIISCELPQPPLTRKYTSIDPAPPTSGLLSGQPMPEDISESNISSLRSKLLDTNVPLFDRYRAMFALRNIGTPAAVDALAAGFSDNSALFK